MRCGPAALPDVLERPCLRSGPVHLGGKQQLGLHNGKTGFLKTPGAQTGLRTDTEGEVMLQLSLYFQVMPQQWESHASMHQVCPSKLAVEEVGSYYNVMRRGLR